MVDDAARGTHDDLCATAQARELNAVSLATVDGQDFDAAEVVRERLEGVCNLQGKLTRRRENEGLRVAGIRIDLGENRQREGCGLARTGLCEAYDVAALHQVRDRLCLNG